MKFQVGDKVRRIIKIHKSTGMKVGDIGIVTKVVNRFSIIIDNLNECRFDPNYFEKVEDNDSINFLP